MHKKRDFKDIMGNLKLTISDYSFFTNFSKVFDRVFKFSNEINELNELIGSQNFENDFKQTIINNPEVLKVIPMLLAKRDDQVVVYSDGILHKYRFDMLYNTLDEYLDFIKKTGIVDLFSGKTVENFYDYLLGIEAGLDSNARKNRGGVAMSNIVEYYIQQSGQIYFKELSTKHILSKFGIDLSGKSKGNNHALKRFDFVVQTSKFLYLIETNFYSSGGSKLNETARSYRQLNQDLKEVEEVKFVWITDGIGWETTGDGFREAYDSIDYLYTIYDLEVGLFENLD